MEDDELKQALMSLIGNNVRRCRMERGLTQQELADMANVDTSTIGRIEGGSRMMSILKLHAVAQALSVSYDSLLQGDGVDARIRNITAQLSDQTPEDLAYIERIIDSVVQYGRRHKSPSEDKKGTESKCFVRLWCKPSRFRALCRA